MNFEKTKNGDCRLIEAYHAIDAGRVSTLSLDFFDTLFWLKVASPDDFFILLGRFFKEEGWLIPAVTAENFAHLRIAAEKEARKEKLMRQNVSEVTLPEIYWHLQKAFVPLSLEEMAGNVKKGVFDTDVSALVDHEVALEKKLLQMDGQILQLMEYAHSKSIPVVLTSNTYFEEDHFTTFLGKHSTRIAHFFLSSEYGCSKEEGLFERLLQVLKKPAEAILHIGDNQKADILPARKLGIQAMHYKKYEPHFEEVLEREWGEDIHQRKLFLDTQEGDFGLTALRSKILHHKELLSLKKEDHFFWKYGATILAPPLLGFIHWVYERCSEMKQSQVFCLMREGKLYAKLIGHLAPLFPQHRLEAKLLWVSRLFITHAALTRGSKKELLAIMEAFQENFTIEIFCSYIGIDMGQIKKWEPLRHVMLNDKNIREELSSFLVASIILRRQIIEKARCKRERYLKYLSTVADLTSSKQLTLVDIGWSGTAQKGLHQIFETSGLDIPLYGLYLGTTQVANNEILKGSIREGYLLRGGDPPFSGYKKGCFVLEQTATAETGTGPLKDIDEQGQVVTFPSLIPLKQKKQAEIAQKGIIAFFNAAAPYLQAKAISFEPRNQALTHQLRTILFRSMMNTTQSEAIKFGAWQHEHTSATNLVQVIGKDIYYEHFIKDMLPEAAYRESSLNWPAAYAAKSSKYLTLMSQAIGQKMIPPECFLSKDTFSCRLFLDTGSGFSKKANHHALLRSNPNRHFYSLMRAFSCKKPILRVQLMLSFPSSLVRIKSLRILSYHQKSPEPQELRFFEDSLFPHLSCEMGSQIDFNTYYCEDHVKLVHRFENPHIYHLRIQLCCEMFQMQTFKKSSDSKEVPLAHKRGRF